MIDVYAVSAETETPESPDEGQRLFSLDPEEIIALIRENLRFPILPLDDVRLKNGDLPSLVAILRANPSSRLQAFGATVLEVYERGLDIVSYVD